MEDIIKDLEAKIRQLKSSPSAHLIREIEELLRDIRRRDDIPQHLKGKLTSTLSSLSTVYTVEMGGDVPHLVDSVVVKIIESYISNNSRSQTLVDGSATSTSGSANAGQTAAEGQRNMNQEIRDKLSKFNILRNFGINPWNK